MVYVLQPLAVRDIVEAAKYIAQDNAVAARRWRQEILAACEAIDKVPCIGHIPKGLPAGIRVFPKGSYLIFYRVTPVGVSVIRVLHAARDWPKLMR
jgi:toxin ParE1/3/4